MADPFSFRLIATDGAARRGEIVTAHGAVATPAFMPVGTQATVKGLAPEAVRASGADIVLANTYHLMLRPGAERIAALGGLHALHALAARRSSPIPAASRSCRSSALRKVDEDGVTFRSHLDGAHGRAHARARGRDPAPARRRHRHAARRVHQAAGSARRDRARHALVAALGRALQARVRERARAGRALFGIVQGGDDPGLAARQRARARRHRLSRLRHRRARGRRVAGGDARDDRGDRARASGRPSALSHGGRHARRSARSGRARHRHVRLRAADPQRPPRRRLHALRRDQPEERPPRRRPAPARRSRAHVRRRATIRAPICTIW